MIDSLDWTEPDKAALVQRAPRLWPPENT